MAMLNNEAALKIAKELTLSAMENKMIAGSNNAEEAANNIYQLYKTLYEKLSGNESQ